MTKNFKKLFKCRFCRKRYAKEKRRATHERFCKNRPIDYENDERIEFDPKINYGSQRTVN